MKQYAAGFDIFSSTKKLTEITWFTLFCLLAFRLPISLETAIHNTTEQVCMQTLEKCYYIF
jgi:hypothetical protein